MDVTFAMDTLEEGAELEPSRHCQEVSLLMPPEMHGSLQQSLPGSRRMTVDQSIESFNVSRRQSTVMTATIRRQSLGVIAQRRLLLEMLQGRIESKGSLRSDEGRPKELDPDYEFRMRNRRSGDDALSTTLSAFYAKFLVVLGIAFPVTDILSQKAPPSFYQGFYLYLYIGSVAFVVYMYAGHLRTRALFSMIDSYQDDKKAPIIKKATVRYGSFYLRVGAIAFGIGSMVYSGLEFGQYFELKGDVGCQNVLIALTPAARTILSIVQMQFIFLNTKDYEMDRQKTIARFGLMHMVATNLCEWLYVIIEETKHEIFHLEQHHSSHLTEQLHNITKRATASEIIVECRRTNIMGTLIQNSSPFLFPCTIEYSLICSVILFEMWKHIRGVDSEKPRKRKISTNEKGAHTVSLDCSRAHRGMFAGILVIVVGIISLIMFYVLSAEPQYHNLATLEVTISEMILYIVTTAGVVLAFLKMRDLKFSKPKGIPLDCLLLLLAQSGVYIYSMFSIIGCYFSVYYEPDNDHGGVHGIFAELFALLQTSCQTIFILNAWHRRTRTPQQSRIKPGRETITFLLVSNMAMWFLNTLVKNRAMFRPTHLRFFGMWAWTIITHVSMPLAIFYRFHSTICLFEIWKTSYKVRVDNSV
ncbi:hypothetical protein HA402_008671 [Bradysia odoriphaga]|nr:hypothetical protein HA402_008671 [Bradysia odoriphaga]